MDNEANTSNFESENTPHKTDSKEGAWNILQTKLEAANEDYLAGKLLDHCAVFKNLRMRINKD